MLGICRYQRVLYSLFMGTLFLADFLVPRAVLYFVAVFTTLSATEVSTMATVFGSVVFFTTKFTSIDIVEVLL